MFTSTLGRLIRRVLRPTAAVRGARGLASQRRRSLRLCLEVLEDRTMPADLFYIGASGGAWDVATNWGLSPSGPPAFVPGPADVAHIGVPGMPPVTVVHGAGFPPDFCGTIVLEGPGATLINSGGSLTTTLLVAPAPGTTVGVGGGTLTAFMVEDFGPAATNAVSGGTFAAGMVGEVAPFITNTVTGGTFAVSGTLMLADPTNTTMLVGGTLDVTGPVVGAGTILLEGGTLSDAVVAPSVPVVGTPLGGTLSSVALGSLDLSTMPGSYVDVVGDLILSGTAFLGNPPGTTSGELIFSSPGSQTVTGGGTILMGSSSMNGVLKTVPGGILTLDPSIAMFALGGSLGGPSSTLSIGTAATNEGSISVLGGGSVTASSSFTSSGAVMIGPGSTFTTAGTFAQTGGTITLASGGTLAAPLVDVAGGTLSGSGTISGDLLNEATVANVAPSGAVLTVTGAYTQTSAATLVLGVGPTAGTLDSLAVGGNVTLDGTLVLAPMGGYTPSPGDTLVVLTFGSNSGATTFATLGGIAASFTAIYDPTDVTLMM
jgi:hypothetical protein